STARASTTTWAARWSGSATCAAYCGCCGAGPAPWPKNASRATWRCCHERDHRRPGLDRDRGHALETDRPVRRAAVRRALAAAVRRLAPRRTRGGAAQLLGDQPVRQRDDAVVLPVLRQAGRGGRAAEPAAGADSRLQPEAETSARTPRGASGGSEQ